MEEKKLKKLLSDRLRESSEEEMEVEGLEGTDIPAEEPPEFSILPGVTQVMKSYQDANRYLDIIKEEILMKYGCVYFSEYVHNLAHTMPVRFDDFGDILHTIDVQVPYPPTGEMEYDISNFDNIFSSIFAILDVIKSSLDEFISLCNDNNLHGIACSVESLLVDITKEYSSLYELRRVYSLNKSSILSFDKWVYLYTKNN